MSFAPFYCNERMTIINQNSFLLKINFALLERVECHLFELCNMHVVEYSYLKSGTFYSVKWMIYQQVEKSNPTRALFQPLAVRALKDSFMTNLFNIRIEILIY